MAIFNFYLLSVLQMYLPALILVGFPSSLNEIMCPGYGSLLRSYHLGGSALHDKPKRQLQRRLWL